MTYCSKCNIDIDKETYLASFKKYKKGLCKDCQKDNFNYQMIKGRIAEALIEQLFLKLGYRVYRYGMENTIPGIMDLLKNVSSDVSKIIRKMPDLVIQNQHGEAYFIEVKFRKDGCFSIRDVEKDSDKYPFENAFFIIVSKKYIKCLSYKDLKDGKEITEHTKNYLGNIKEFETDKETIIEFCDYAKKFFERVD